MEYRWIENIKSLITLTTNSNRYFIRDLHPERLYSRSKRETHFRFFKCIHNSTSVITVLSWEELFKIQMLSLKFSEKLGNSMGDKISYDSLKKANIKNREIKWLQIH